MENEEELLSVICEEIPNFVVIPSDNAWIVLPKVKISGYVESEGIIETEISISENSREEALNKWLHVIKHRGRGLYVHHNNKCMLLLGGCPSYYWLDISSADSLAIAKESRLKYLLNKPPVVEEPIKVPYDDTEIMALQAKNIAAAESKRRVERIKSDVWKSAKFFLGLWIAVLAGTAIQISNQKNDQIDK